jgi:hypothetical protein
MGLLYQPLVSTEHQLNDRQEKTVLVLQCLPHYFHTDYPVSETGPPRSDAGHCPALPCTEVPRHKQLHRNRARLMLELRTRWRWVVAFTFLSLYSPPPQSTVKDPLSTERHRSFFTSVTSKNVCFGISGLTAMTMETGVLEYGAISSIVMMEATGSFETSVNL